MEFALTLVATTVACFVLRNPIRKAPMVFYVLSIALTAFCIAMPYLGLPREIWVFMSTIMRKCLLPLALFVVVMFIGVLPRTSKASLWLRPIRAELSIIAWILTLGHVVIYFNSYFPRVGGLSNNMLASLVVAMLLFVLLIVLGVTSFQFVKKRMNHDTWKKVQKLAYPFFILVYVHLLLIFVPSAMNGGVQAQINIAVYTVLFVAYIVLRLLRAAKGDGVEHSFRHEKSKTA
ncbi:MAG: ferric reductase-like transmembrane domain-containing protein [Eggerthellaceae bacterium]|nr:ferric reductase-like transmembrane domain-containing protein [Eggerthellaceae bacterium]